MSESNPEADIEEPEPTAAEAEPSPSTRPRLSVEVVAVLAIVAVAALAAWFAFAPAPELGLALRLAEGGRYSEAEPRLAEYLAYDPSNVRAGLALADVLLNLDPPKPAEAIERLDAIRGASPQQSAFALMLRGKAHRAQGRPGKAEAEWKEALAQDPLVAQAGWLLLDLYYSEGRTDDARRLALRLHRSEPDPRDRVRLLLEPIRPDAEPLAASGLIAALRPVVKEYPDDLFPALAYYRALAKDGTGTDEAMTGLRRLTAAHPEESACWEGLLSAMASLGDLDGVESTLAKLPPGIASQRWLTRYRGQVAEFHQDYAGAIRNYTESLADSPGDLELLYRLSKANRFAGREDEAKSVKLREADVKEAQDELRGIKEGERQQGRPGLFEDAMNRPSLGRVPDPALYQQLAAIRERMGHPDEALAWHKLVLRDAPDDTVSREAAARLEKALGGDGASR
jgi:tetratricopeptide (TPR) repeat protein